MDSITQAALGAALGGAVLGRRLGRKAVLIGALLGTLPDLDVALDYNDAIINMTEHRGFSHSVFVLTGLATLLALLSRRFSPARDISLPRWWCFFTLCLVTHPLLDSLTAYGTQLLWPLDTPPAAWPIIFIIDPVYTLALLIGLGAGLASQRLHRYCVWGLAASSLYLALAAGAKWHVEQRLAPAIAEQGLTQLPIIVQPTPFNILLWRATIVGEDRYYESLVSVFDSPRLPQLEPLWRNTGLERDALAGPLGQRLTWFTGPFLRYDVHLIDDRQTLVATDIRLGFPGFHPFSFTLATREEDQWVPVTTSEAVKAPRGISLATLSRLAERATGNVTALCASDFVASHWRVERFVYRC